MLLAHPAPPAARWRTSPSTRRVGRLRSSRPKRGGERGGFVGLVTDRIKTSGLPARRALLALALVLLLVCSVAVVWVSALQAQVPRHMPFGVTGASPVVTAAESAKVAGYRISFVNTTYPNEAASSPAGRHRTRGVGGAVHRRGDVHGGHRWGRAAAHLLAVDRGGVAAALRRQPVPRRPLLLIEQHHHPIVVLLVYALIAAAALGYVEWIRPRRATEPSDQAGGPGTGRTGGRARSRS